MDYHRSECWSNCYYYHSYQPHSRQRQHPFAPPIPPACAEWVRVSTVNAIIAVRGEDAKRERANLAVVLNVNLKDEVRG
ncbi:hypothetical protein [Candidatus Odyssella acanthamoebae]|uniref:hypothetical protein n=1 Tax=Candidatus Odyssella acanthamoebae TaxID=91604 RepID=UPI0018DB65EA|nr:hypothetical protein [Candidatus Paracaedibacter acanthamoebae]